MINLMIVAGDRTAQLSKFLEERGTFVVDYAYESLGLNLAKIKDSIISADQLLYLYQEDFIDIRTDMQLLKELLTKNGFFTVKDIVFIVPECDSQKKAISYFSSVMSSSKFTNFSIKEVERKPSFNDIYDSIIGVSKAQTFNNTYNNVYRVERGVESKTAYEEENDIDLSIEPFNYDGLKDYQNAKQIAKRTDSGLLYNDNHIPDIEKFEQPVLGHIEIESVLSDTENFIITGLEKSGVSTWTIALAVSTMRTGKPVTIIDLTDNRDVKVLAEQQGLAVNSVTMLDMIKLYRPKTGVLNVLSIRNEKEESVQLEFLQNIYSSNKIEKGYIFIVANYRKMSLIASVLCNDLTKTFFCINPIESDVLRVQSLLAEYVDAHSTILILNDRVWLMDGNIVLKASDVKKLLPFNLPIVQPINFDSLDVDLTLFNALIKGKEA